MPTNDPFVLYTVRELCQVLDELEHERGTARTRPDLHAIDCLRDHAAGLLERKRGSKRGRRTRGSKLTIPAVRNILARINSGERQCAIAADLGIAQWTVSAINVGRIWGALRDEFYRQRRSSAA